MIIYISVEQVTLLNFETAAKKAVDREKEMNKVQMDQNKLVMEQEKLKAMLKNKPTNKK